MKRNKLYLILIFLSILSPFNFLFAQSPTILWSKLYGDKDFEEGWCIKETSDKGFLVSGYRNKYDSLNNQIPKSIFILKTDNNGNVEWQKDYGSHFEEWGLGITEISDGYIITGSSWPVDSIKQKGNVNLIDVYVLKINKSGDIDWENYYGGRFSDYGVSTVQADNGEYVVFGYTQSKDNIVPKNHGKYDYFICLSVFMPAT